MKKVIRIMPVILLFACSSPQLSEDVKTLVHKRDSLQNVQLDIEQELIQLRKQIALLDTVNDTKDELKLIKKIALQKNKVVKLNRNVKKLENELKSMHKEKKLTPVTVKELSGEPFAHKITVFGNVEADQFAQVAPEMGGQIRKIHVKAGQYVTKEQLLVTLNTDAVANQVKAIKTNLELANTTFEKQKTLWDKGIGSEIQYLQAKSAKEGLESQLKSLEAQRRMSQIRAPFNGFVDKIHQKEGMLAAPQFAVLDMVNLNGIQIKADVSETYIGDINKGDVVELSFSSLPGVKEKTPIVRTSKVIDQNSRTFEIEVWLQNKNKAIRPNMVAKIEITDFRLEEAIKIPSNVIRRDISNNKDYVYVVEEENNEMFAKKRIITTGMADEDETLIVDGLKKGDKVVVEGYHLISNGIAVKISGNKY